MASARNERRLARLAAQLHQPGQAGRIRGATRGRAARLDRRNGFGATLCRGPSVGQEIPDQVRRQDLGGLRVSHALRAWALLLASLVLLAAVPARAHEMTMAEM